MKNFIQKGETMTLVAPAAISSGDVVIVGGFIGVAAIDAAIGEDVETNLCGVYELAKAAEAFSQGDTLYWDATNEELTTTSTDNTLIGLATADFGSGAATATVRLFG